MSIEHNVITETDLHEPKGISTAAANAIHVADGAGSGTWKIVFTSSDTTITSGFANYEVSHGLGFTPKIYTAYIRNTTAEFGYSIGDKIDVGCFSSGMSLYASSTKLGLTTFATFLISRKDNGTTVTMTPANWVLVFQALPF